MMKRGWVTPVLVSLICIIILFSYQSKYFGQSHASDSNLPQIPWEKSLGDIVQLDISAGTQLIQIKNEGSDWKMTSPISVPIDVTYLYDALSYVLKPPISSTVASPVQSPKNFGIDTYSKKISLIDQDGKKYELICGNEADATSYYALEPLSNTIYTIDKNAFDKMSTLTDYWRNRKYIKFNPETIATIEINGNNQHHIISKNMLHNEISFESETLTPDLIDQFIRFLKTSRVEQFIVDNASSEIISSYGFDSPTFSLVLKNSDGTSQSLAIQADSTQGKCFYILDRESGSIYTIPYFNLQMIQSTYGNITENAAINKEP